MDAGDGIYVQKIEEMIKTARDHIARGDNVAASVTIMAAYAESDSVAAGFTVQQKISLCSNIATIYREIGMTRKFSFFLRETALHCKSIHLWRRSHALLKLVAPFYQVQLPRGKSVEPSSPPQENQPATSPLRKIYKTRRQQLLESGKQWVDIQAAVYDSLIEVTSEMKDHDPISYVITFLSTLGPHLPSEKQISLSTSLAHLTKRFPAIDYEGNAGMLAITCSSIQEANRGSKVVELELEDARIARCGPFLYKPKRNQVATTSELQTAADTAIVVRLAIENIFNFAVSLQHLMLKHEELDTTCDPILHMHLQPHTTKQIDFTLTPKAVGQIKELTLCYRTFNCLLKQKVKLDTLIKITEALSVLNVSCPSFNGSITLFPGEHYNLELSMQNIGTQEIDFINVSCKETLSAKAEAKENENLFASKRKRTVTWDNDVITAALPMSPKQAVLKLPVSIIATKEVTGGRFTIKYGRMAEIKDSQRSLDFGITFNVTSGLKLIDWDIKECTKASLQRFNELPPTNHLKIVEDAPHNAYCIATLSIKNFTDQSFHLEVDGNPQQKIKGEDNTSFFSSESFATVEPLAIKRISLPVPRIYFKKSQIPIIEPAVRKYITKEYQLTPEQFNVSHACQFYRDSLVNSLSIRWHCVSQNSNGTVSLHTIKFDTSKLLRYKKSDVLLRVGFLNSSDEPITSSHPHSIIKVRVQATNQTESAVGPFQLSLLPLVAQATSVSWVGKIDQLPIGSIESEASVEHLFAVCVHSPGIFRFVASAQLEGEDRTYWSVEEELTVADK